MCDPVRQAIYDKRHRLKNHDKWKLEHHERQKALRSKRVALLNSIKMERGCVDCGYNAAPEALHFDHRDPTTKLFGIGNNRSTALDRLLIEIEKCDVRCANCHAIRSKKLGHHNR